MPIIRSDEEVEVHETFKDASPSSKLFDDSSLCGEQEEFVCFICK